MVGKVCLIIKRDYCFLFSLSTWQSEVTLFFFQGREGNAAVAEEDEDKRWTWK